MEEKTTNKLGMSLAFDAGIAELTSIEAAVVYNELKFWGESDKGERKDGWIYKSYAEMLEKLPISEYQLRKAYKVLEKQGIIETKIMKKSGVPTFHFRFLKNFRMETEKTSETMETEKTSETTIYTDNYHNTDKSDASASQPEPLTPPTPSLPKDFVDQERVDDRERLHNLFEALKKELGTERAKFPAERRAKLKNRLKTFSEDELLLAARNIRHNPHMQGKNDSNKFYGTIEYLLRNDGNVEKWLFEPVQQTRSAF